MNSRANRYGASKLTFLTFVILPTLLIGLTSSGRTHAADGPTWKPTRSSNSPPSSFGQQNLAQQNSTQQSFVAASASPTSSAVAAPTRAPSRPLQWKPRNPVSFQANGHNVVTGFSDASRVVQASGEVENPPPSSAPRLLAPSQPSQMDAFEDPFNDQTVPSQEYYAPPPAEPASEPTLATPRIQRSPSSHSTSEITITDLPEPTALPEPIGSVQPSSTEDKCIDKYRDYPGDDRDCKVAACKLNESLIQSISLNIDPRRDPGFDAGDTVPYECWIGNEPYNVRCWAQTTFTWKASALCHKPLYFEEEKLERYGHSWGPLLQPLASGAHFVTNIALLPYKMGINPSTECQYVLGHYRPGNCAPWLIDPFPISLRGAAYQASAVFGGLYLIP